MSLPSSVKAMATRMAVAASLARKRIEVGTVREGWRLSSMYSRGESSQRKPHGTNTGWEKIPFITQ